MVNPGGVITEIVACPALTGVNSVRKLSDAPVMVTGETTVPTLGLLLFRLTVMDLSLIHI